MDFVSSDKTSRSLGLGDLITRIFSENLTGQIIVDEWYNTLRYCKPDASDDELKNHYAISK